MDELDCAINRYGGVSGTRLGLSRIIELLYTIGSIDASVRVPPPPRRREEFADVRRSRWWEEDKKDSVSGFSEEYCRTSSSSSSSSSYSTGWPFS
jgi:hypothetical protein